MSNKLVLLWLGLLLGGCQTMPRRDAPPEMIGHAVPEGFSENIRIVTTDMGNFAEHAPVFFDGLSAATTDGSVDILALSGGGSSGAYGAGALVGLSRTHARPEFEMVTGVSAGALLAPFAFLGQDWDVRMEQAFTGKRISKLLRSPSRAFLARLLSPRGPPRRNPLFELVDHFVSPQMLSAVASEAAQGRRLIVATTDLDKQESVLWNMGKIAQRGGPEARILFRDVLIASASVPGLFAPVLIRVGDGKQEYDEMHVDGSVTTSVFALPLIVGIQSYELPQLRGANLYVIVNGQLARPPRTTPFNTVDVLSSSFSSEMTYKTRGAIVESIAAAERLGMTFRMTEIPLDYPQERFIDFDQKRMRVLFDYAASCAAQNLLWMTPEQSVRRNMGPSEAVASGPLQCPVAVIHP